MDERKVATLRTNFTTVNSRLLLLVEGQLYGNPEMVQTFERDDPVVAVYTDKDADRTRRIKSSLVVSVEPFTTKWKGVDCIYRVDGHPYKCIILPGNNASRTVHQASLLSHVCSSNRERESAVKYCLSVL